MSEDKDHAENLGSSVGYDADLPTTTEWLRKALPPWQKPDLHRRQPIHCWDDLSWRFCIMLSGYEQYWTAPLDTRGKVRDWARLMDFELRE